ncbi:PKD domain-containing protein [Hydrogenimonas cancrithermarum]|uniref:PKD domain-containing protein n=1 Tax=Hydrogenimonas cancrithermarum TaxID=2993563 RepID=A0ABN6WUA5_9BACT|nr:PKD domain-containing protein [Hydrogenimonas cancrithermarum]BDY12649.1 hypothetical protein HCR_09610 [Hydrogenimonas cancrithermarum]
MGLSFKNKMSSLLLAASITFVGCGGGGGGGGTEPAGTITANGVTVVSGTTGSQTSGTSGRSIFKTRQTSGTESAAVASVTVDTNEDGIFDEKDPTFTSSVENGAFSVEIPLQNLEKTYKGRISVIADGYAPYNKIIEIKAGQTINVLAEAEKIPVLKETVNLSDLSESARMGSYIRFGIRTTADGGVNSFSKLVSLSELKAEADANASLGKEDLATYTFPLASVPKEVKTLDVTMQAFDSTKPDELQYFPGEFKGKGLSNKANAADDEVGLISAAFDMFVMRDQNGDPVKLIETVNDKLSANVDLSNCSMKWVRRITQAQAQLIEGWGDYDPSTPEFEVPIWSNDNSEGTWKFVGVGNAYDLNGTDPYFEVCIPDEWNSGYLNCDSPISFTQPIEVCVETYNNNGFPIEGLQVYAQKSSTYTSSYTDANGHTVLEIPDADITGWNFYYKGAITGWSGVDVSASPIPVTDNPECAYELNVTGIVDPYSAGIYVTAYKIDGTPAANENVYLKSTDYYDYYHKSKTTDDEGKAFFKVKPNVSYTATYRAGSANVKVDGNLVPPETADTGRYASVDVNDTNIAPRGHIYFYKSRLKPSAEHVKFNLSARDANGDTITIKQLSLNGTVLKNGSDYTILDIYSYTNGYLSTIMELNLTRVSHIAPQALQVGTYRLEAVVTDGTAETPISGEYSVVANAAPIVNGATAYDENGRMYNIGYRPLPSEGLYDFYIYAFDPDGDTITINANLDGTPLVCNGFYCTDANLTVGDRTLTVTATDSDGASGSHTFRFHVGNLPPRIASAGATRDIVDINNHESFRLFAYANDPEGESDLLLKAIDQNGTEHNLTKSRGSLYQSEAIEPTDPGIYIYTITAQDSKGALSGAATVTVEVIASNRPPIFTKQPHGGQITVGTTQTFECEAIDPEGTPVSYSWKLDDAVLPATGTTLSHLFDETGNFTVTCIATDLDGESSSASAKVYVIDPNQSGTLTVRTSFPGVLVGIHDASDHYRLIGSKRTDSNGVASFSVTGDRTTFSVTVEPSMILDTDTVYELLVPMLVNDASYNCRYGDINMSECDSADWCAIMTADFLPAWIIDAALIKGGNVTSSDVDANGDGIVTRDEFHAAAIATLDKNGDGALSLKEIYDDENIILSRMYANAPVRTYDIPFGPWGYYTEGEEPYFYECYANEDIDFNITVTNVPSPNAYIDMTGSCYTMGYEINGSSSTAHIKARAYYTDENGTYDFGIKFSFADHNVSIYLATDKTAADLANGVTLDYANFVPFDRLKDVNITERTTEWLWVTPTYKNVTLATYEQLRVDYLEKATIRHYKYLDDARLNYPIKGQQSINNQTKGHNDYYGDGTLQSAYDGRNYAYLDLNITSEKGSQTVRFVGNDWPKIDMTTLDYRTDLYTREQDNEFSFTLIDFAPSATIDFGDVNLSEIYPQTVADEILSFEENESASHSMSANAEEFKNMTSYEFIDIFFDSGYGKYSFYLNVPGRYVTADGLYQPMAAYSSLGKKKKPHRKANPFTIPFDPRLLLRK